ncbi:MAG TPA: hypothetical protein VJ810_22265 [Blastocatellia bacterium]|nr:hypothetical protein [Blastocatellia bacterium]
MKQLSVIVFGLFLCAGASSEAFAQRKAVSGAEVTGTFRYYFTGRFKDSYNEILIQALGGNKLKIEMKLIRPLQIAEDRVSVNVGEANGEALIQGDTAGFTPEDAIDEKSCRIRLQFTEPGTLIVTTELGGETSCGFGNGVHADGTYKKISDAKPKFGVNSSGYVEPLLRKAVSGAEVTGTFRSCHAGKYKGFCNEILIQALGANKLKVEMSLIYPYESAAGMNVHQGRASGEAVIQGDTADFTAEEAPECKIRLEFTKPGTLDVTMESGSGIGCGFGHNVSADGTYQKTSGAKPKFGVNKSAK